MPDKMTGVRVWYSEFIEGIESFYDYQTIGPRLSPNTANAKMVEFGLNADERIIKISGRASKQGI
jgi:hypothetical protein